MAKNHIQPGNHLDLTMGANVSSGDGVIVGQLFGVVMSDALSGDQVAVAVEGVFSLPKDGSAYSEGDAVDWDGSQIVAGGGGSLAAGIVVKAALAGDAEVHVKLERP